MIKFTVEDIFFLQFITTKRYIKFIFYISQIELWYVCFFFCVCMPFILIPVLMIFMNKYLNSRGPVKVHKQKIRQDV